MTALKTRKPTGAVPYPLVLVEGEEKAGKTWAAIQLSADERVGTTYVIDLGEGTADEYGAIPDADFEIVEHDGTYAQILDAILAVKDEAKRAKAADEPPVVLVIDTVTDLWGGLKDWTSERAIKSDAGKRTLAKDPHAEVKPTMNLWNDAAARHRKAMTQLLTFPGIVVLTARGKEVVEVRDGRPVEGARAWSVDTHKDVPFDATLWIRMRRGQSPEVVGARSVHVGLRPGQDDPQKVVGEHDSDLLGWLIFDVLKVDATTAHTRDVRAVTGGELTEDEKAEELARPPEGRESAQRQRRQGKPAEDQFQGPPVTDAARYEAWQAQVSDCSDLAALDELAKVPEKAHTTGHLTAADLEDAKVLVDVQRKEIERRAAKPGEWTDVTTAPIPGAEDAA